MVVGALLDFASLAFAAQSVIAPVSFCPSLLVCAFEFLLFTFSKLSGGVSLVANAFIAHFWLKEHLNKRDVVGTILIIVGIVVSVAFGNKEEVPFQDIRLS